MNLDKLQINWPGMAETITQTDNQAQRSAERKTVEECLNRLHKDLPPVLKEFYPDQLTVEGINRIHDILPTIKSNAKTAYESVTKYIALCNRMFSHDTLFEDYELLLDEVYKTAKAIVSRAESLTYSENYYKTVELSFEPQKSSYKQLYNIKRYAEYITDKVGDIVSAISTYEQHTAQVTPEEVTERFDKEMTDVVEHHGLRSIFNTSLFENIRFASDSIDGTRIAVENKSITVRTPCGRLTFNPFSPKSITEQKQKMGQKIRNLFPDISDDDFREKEKLASSLFRTKITEQRTNDLFVKLSVWHMLDGYEKVARGIFDESPSQVGRPVVSFYDCIDKEELIRTFDSIKENLQVKEKRKGEYAALYLLAYFKDHIGATYGKVNAYFNALLDIRTAITFTANNLRRLVEDMSKCILDFKKSYHEWCTRKQNNYSRCMKIRDAIISEMERMHLKFFSLA